MSIRSLKQRADKLACRADDLRVERNNRTERSLAIVRRRVGSPVGLAVCFGVGVAAGSRLNNRKPDAKRATGDGVASQLLHGPVGAAAIKLATAFLAGSILKGDEPAATGDDQIG